MSSILKALEKVEESRSTRRNVGASGLAKRPERRRPAWVVPAGVLGGAAFAALVTFAAMGGFSRTAGSARQVQVTTLAKPASLVAAPPHPVTEAPAARPKLTLPVKTAKSVVKPKVKASPASQTAPTKVTTVSAVQTVAPEKARPAIKVTGIAWQKDSVSSAALVNGHPVQQGSMVDGLKVEEIFQDKVRFSGSNGNLDVPLGGGD